MGAVSRCYSALHGLYMRFIGLHAFLGELLGGPASSNKGPYSRMPNFSARKLHFFRALKGSAFRCPPTIGKY